jgi:Protein of unknown function (DUF1612)/HTH DNA binding domain
VTNAYALPALRHVRSSMAASLELATSTVVRLDEQIARLGRVGEGYRSRVEFQEACALRALAGELVRLEDLALADAGASVRLSTIELTRARHILEARRTAAAKPPAWAWSDDALFERRLRGVDRDELLYDLGEEDWDEDARLDQWRTIIGELDGLPTMLKAAIAWDAWLRIEPLHGESWRSTALAASMLRAGGLTQHHLMAIGIGGRRSRYRDDGRLPFEQRLKGFLDWILLAAEAGQKELQRLALAEKVLRQVARHSHVDSRLPALIDLVMSRPIISAEIVKRELKVTDTGFRRLREALGTSVKELSGRRRYQVWGVL